MGLTLRRHVHEKILIGDDITITVVDAGPNWVRLDVEAPRSVAVDREEVRRRRLAAAVEVPADSHPPNSDLLDEVRRPLDAEVPPCNP